MFWVPAPLVDGAKTRLESSTKKFKRHLNECMLLLLLAGSGQGATNDVWTGAVDIVIVNVVGRSVSHTLTWVVRPVHCVVVHVLT